MVLPAAAAALQACNARPHARSWPQRVAHRRPRWQGARRVACAGTPHTHARMHAPAAGAPLPLRRCCIDWGRRGDDRTGRLVSGARESVTRASERACMHARTGSGSGSGSGSARGEVRAAGAMRFGQVCAAVGRAQPRRSLCWHCRAGRHGNCEPCLPGPADEPRPTPHVPVPVMSAVSRPPGLGISIRIYVKAKATAHPYHRHYRPLPSPAARSNRVLPSHPVGFLHLFLFQRRLYVPSLSGGPLSYKA